MAQTAAVASPMSATAIASATTPLSWSPATRAATSTVTA
jgi:hypothetical protein